MRWWAAGIAGVAWLLLARPAAAQYQPPSEKFVISASSAFTWSQGDTTVLQLEGPVTITLDRATLTARQAVVWLSPAADGAPGEQRAQFALFGDATIRQQVGQRSGQELLVTAEVLGEPQTHADQRVARDMSATPLYQRALALRKQTAVAIAPPPVATSGPTSRGAPASRPRRPTSRPASIAVPVHVEAGHTDIVDTEEGTVAVVVWDGVKVVARQPSGDEIEMQSQRAVLYTALPSLKDAQQHTGRQNPTEKVTGIYLEGDARIEYLPSRPKTSEQRLMADRVYYDFGTDRAILLDAVLHTYDANRQVPFIVRGKTLRQLSKGEYTARDVQITSSSFAVPSYGIAADRLYVRSEATGDPQFPEVINYQASEAKVEAFDVPFLYFPSIAGSIGDRPGALRDIGFASRSDFGFSFLSEWGLFETLGQVPPRSLDASYRLDYFTERGPGFGLNAAYGGGFLTEPAHEPFNFLGDFQGYFVYDKGTDNFGRLPVKPGGGPTDEYVPRGRALYEHQHFFPDDWQAQIRLGYVSDPTFLEEWFPRDFYERGPEDVSAYVKHQRDTEAFTLLVEAQPNKLVTTSDREAEQFEIERLPELGYHRVGDSFADDKLTFFSDNTVAGLQFQPTRATLRQQGFLLPNINPGIPALGQTGITTSPVYRADFREEIDWPIVAGHFNAVPYLIGRYTEYSNSPEGSNLNRFYGAAGVRVATSFWKVDPTAHSDLFDIHQLRHVIQPELNLFTSATSVDRSRLYQYDQAVDQINDTSAVEFGLRQEWETKRGGPGKWRSTDVFTLDLTATFYSNKPSRKFLDPYDFRGIFFSSLPETSIPRDSFNADAAWRISDNTVVLANAEYNIDENKLATAGIGILVRRDIDLSYYLGNRYIADLNSNITSIQFQYRISPKYELVVGQDFDFGLGQNVQSSVGIVRHFDRFTMLLRGSYDEISKQESISFNLYPEGLGNGLGTGAFAQGPFRR